MSENTNKWNAPNPWLGLGTYHEGQRLYGRDKETAALTGIIINHTASVVYGKSGIGKSSLLRAGVFPQLRSNGFVPIYIRLAHNTEISYVQQIENAISENVKRYDMLPNHIPDLGLWDYLHRHRFTDSNDNCITPVIVLDQFEEIFTLTQVEHKTDVQALFTELADVLNDVKPDKVIGAEVLFVKSTSSTENKTNSSGFILQSLSNASLKYEKSPLFRFVFSLRDDSLYLLERNSAKIPAVKVNRYNLCPLDEVSALEVIMQPRPELFTENEGKDILDGLTYYEYEDYRVVDPAILSLFLFSYYKEQGKLAYTDIFGRYYQDCTKDIKDSSISYIEDHLLTDRGNRNQIPVDEMHAMGISTTELNSLIQRKILREEKRKGISYVEFSHDRLCEQALKNREERKQNEQTRKMRKRMIIVSLIILSLLGFAGVQLFQYKRILQSQVAEIQAIQKADKANWEKDSINRLNKIIEEQKSRLQDDSIIKSWHLTRIQDDSTKLVEKAFNLQTAMLSIKSINDSLKLKAHNLVVKNATIDSLNDVLRKELETEIKKNNQGMVLYTSCINMRNSLEDGNMTDLKIANNLFKSCKGHFWGGTLRPIKEETLSFNGHFLFSPVFVDSLIAYGDRVYQYSDHYNKIQYLQGAIREDLKTVNYRTCMVGGASSVKYSFFTRGHQELAFVTEPNGKIGIRIYDRTSDKWYNFETGLPYRFVTLELPTDKRSQLEVEIINKVDDDISFVIISN